MRTLETVDRALALLLAFESADGNELTVAAIADRLGIHRSSASRFAATLAERGFLERNAGGDAYRLGPAMARLGLLAMVDRGLIASARPVMERLAVETGETVVLSALDGDQGVSIAQVNGSHLVGMRDWIGRRSPLDSSSDGKVFLAFASTGPPGPHPVVREELDAIRRRGWATSEGEAEPGLNGVAAPIWDAEHRCVAALSLCGPAYRLAPEGFAVIAERLGQAAAEVSATLGRAASEV